MNKPFSDTGRTFPMPATSVNFSNGMIVTAEDLSAAMTYPVMLMQSVNRAVYGCGVACGFPLEPDPDLCGREERCDPCDDNSEMAYPSFTVQVGRGTAIDCSGMPVELCKPAKIDLGDRSCGCEVKEGKVCIYIRRVSAPQAARGDCCGGQTGVAQCSRMQDHVEIRAFPWDEPPDHACMHPMAEDNGDCGCNGDGNDNGGRGRSEQNSGSLREAVRDPEYRYPERDEICKCLLQCGDCDCCGEGWILLGCLTLCKGGIVSDSFENPYSHRKWIKTIECFCRKRKVEEQVEPEYYVQQDQSDAEVEFSSGRSPDYAVLWAEEPEPGFEEKLHDLIGDYKREATFVAAGATNLERLRHLLEVRQAYLQGAFGLKSPDVLRNYLRRIDEDLSKERKK